MLKTFLTHLWWWPTPMLLFAVAALALIYATSGQPPVIVTEF